METDSRCVLLPFTQSAGRKASGCWNVTIDSLRSGLSLKSLIGRAFLVVQMVNNLPGALGFVPGSGRSPGGGNGYPLQHSCWEDPMDRGAWRAAVHGVTNGRMRLSGGGAQPAQSISESHFHSVLTA